MIYSNEGHVHLDGKVIDILVDVSIILEDIFENTPKRLRPMMLDAIKSSADLAMRLVEKDESSEDKRTDDDVLSEYMAKVLNNHESEEE